MTEETITNSLLPALIDEFGKMNNFLKENFESIKHNINNS